jgi:cyclohexanone monooxygenase
MTGPLLRLNVTGRDGLRLAEAWEAGPRTYLGLQVAGFPNLFTITGPGSPSVISNVIVSIEQHVDWIAACLDHLREHHVDTIEPDPGAEDAWVQHVSDVAAATLYPQAPSWFVGANVPGKPRVFMPYLGGVPAYRQKCEQVVAAGYEGFVLDRRAVRA